MKKAVIFVCLVCFCAVVSQAASMTWTLPVNSLKNLTGSGNVSGASLMLIQASNTSDLNAYITGLENGTYNSSTFSGVSGVTFVGQGTTLASGGMGAKESTSASLPNATALNFYVVAFNSFASQPYFEVSATVNQTSYTAPTTPNTASFGAATFGAGSYTHAYPGAQNGWVPIPEPCTMALFGIGAAVIGLRRRFTKKS